MDKMSSGQKFGQYISYADSDLLSSAVLFKHNQWQHALYHGLQSSEKYLKAFLLFLDHKNPDRDFKDSDLHTHNIKKLVEKIQSLDKSFNFDWMKEIENLSHIDQTTRYPLYSINKSQLEEYQNTLCSSDFEFFCLFALFIRPKMVEKYSCYFLEASMPSCTTKFCCKKANGSSAGIILSQLYPDAEYLVWRDERPPGTKLIRRFPRLS